MSQNQLSGKACVPCQGGIPPLKGEQLENLMKEIGHEWHLVNEHHIERTFNFADFAEALNFTNRIGELAEQENHHPDILLAYGKVKITIYTHKIDGLTESDFILAAKTNMLA